MFFFFRKLGFVVYSCFTNTLIYATSISRVQEEIITVQWYRSKHATKTLHFTFKCQKLKLEVITFQK